MKHNSRPPQITCFDKDYLPEAAALFVRNFRKLRLSVPEAPSLMEEPERVTTMLAELFASCPGVMALDQGRLLGYMGWFIVDEFRGTDRKGAYCPEWGHAAAEGIQSNVYRAMYRLAAEQWADQKCQVHAVTLLANDPEAEKVWFWNGFGLTGVDAVRSTQPLGVAGPSDFVIRKSTSADAELLSVLDAEHWMHYSSPPIFMVPHTPGNAAEFSAFIDKPDNSVWLAMDGHNPAGFIQFERVSFGAAQVVQSETTIAITGAYVRPEYRGKKIAAAILNAGLRNYATRGFVRCSVDFESFNPEAVGFWMRYFRLVCLSVVRVPET
jgi:GNAT superfamily N-acetyltransferase